MCLFVEWIWIRDNLTCLSLPPNSSPKVSNFGWRVRFLFTEEEWRMELLWITTHKRWGGPVFGVGRVRRDKLCAQTIWWQPACRAQKGSCPHIPPPRVGKKSTLVTTGPDYLINNHLINLSLVRWSVRPPHQLSSSINAYTPHLYRWHSAPAVLCDQQCKSIQYSLKEMDSKMSSTNTGLSAKDLNMWLIDWTEGLAESAKVLLKENKL